MAKKSVHPLRLRQTHHPLLYEVNARLLLRELSRKSAKAVTLGTIPDSVIDSWAAPGFDAVWLMGIWTPSSLSRTIAWSHPSLKERFHQVLPDVGEEDVDGSPYAIKAYTVPRTLGGGTGLQKLRTRLHERGIALVLDYVPNHTARDHRWVREHPEYYVHGEQGEEASKPDHFFRSETTRGAAVLAHGRDPGSGAWTDTAQLNVRHPAARGAMMETLRGIAGQCDGVRCDMAMLVLESVFTRTWGDRVMPDGAQPAAGEFWAGVIGCIRREFPDFLFIAEAYWNLEWDLQQLGFQYTYDKTLYDRLLHEGAGAVRDHLRAEMAYQLRSLRFLENHDEQRVAHALPSEPWQFAAATIVATVPGMAMFHDGQFEGRKLTLPVQLLRRPEEKVADTVKAFYARLLPVVSDHVFRTGSWQLLMPKSAWSENHTWQNFLAFWWHEPADGIRLVVVNYAPLPGQCYIDLPLDAVEGNPIEFRDLLGEAAYARDRHGLTTKGMYFDLPPYGLHIFEVGPPRKPKK
ncbi:MAG: alpha-amylase family glycosyl hydrolase [Bacteroidota bacterium]